MEDDFEAETSFAQESLWLQHQLSPFEPTYHVAATVRVRGVLDAGALHRALGTVVGRHEALRTTFDLVDGTPRQVIRPPAPVDVRVVDAGPGEIDALVEAEIRTPFDLRRGPLLRCTLLRRAADDHVVVLTMHHIITDGASSEILFTELVTAYEAHLAGHDPRLAELPIQYADFAVWQRDRLRGEHLNRLTAYWSERLHDSRPALLPTDRPRPDEPTTKGRSLWFTLPGELVERLDRIARERGATLFMALLAGFDVLLARFGAPADVTVAVPTAGRERPELEGLVGYFINTLPARADLSDDPAYDVLLDRVREDCLGAWAHQEVPFSLLLERMRADRRGSTVIAEPPVMMVLQNMRRPSWQAAGLEFEPIWTETGTAKAELLLDISPGDRDYRARLEFRTELWDPASIERLAASFVTLLGAIADDPSARVSSLALLTGDERARALAAETAGPASARWESPSAAVAHWAVAAPATTAIADDQGIIGYADLHERATDVAAVLRAHGVGPGRTVALACEPGVRLGVLLLAVHRAGAAAVVLDPADPDRWRERAIGAAGASHLVAGPGTRTAPEGVTLIDMDRLEAETGAAVEGASPVAADATAMIAPDAGTGARSGVRHTHRQLAAGASASAALAGLRAGDRYLALTSRPARLVAEWWQVLVAGATLVVPGPETVVEDTAATVISLGDSRVAQLPAVALPPAVRTVLAWDDQTLSAADLSRWTSVPDHLLQLHTVPEVAGFHTAHRVDPLGGAQFPPTHPAGLRVLVLDDRSEPVPSGAIGELCVSGAAVAAGYHGDPHGTAAAFVPDPHDTTPGHRLLRTGELVRLRADGSMTRTAHRDGLARVGGLRIDPDLAGRQVADHPDVAAQAVLTAPAPTGGDRLICYVVPRTGVTVPAAEIMAHLRERLPEEVVPRVIVPVTAIPRTRSGDVDVAALPAAEPDATGGTGFLAPRTPFEEELAKIWQEVLDVDRIGVHDNFFELGGQSLAMINVAARVREVFGVELSLRSLYANFTVATMSWRLLEELSGADDDLPG